MYLQNKINEGNSLVYEVAPLHLLRLLLCAHERAVVEVVEQVPVLLEENRAANPWLIEQSMCRSRYRPIVVELEGLPAHRDSSSETLAVQRQTSARTLRHTIRRKQ